MDHHNFSKLEVSYCLHDLVSSHFECQLMWSLTIHVVYLMQLCDLVKSRVECPDFLKKLESVHGSVPQNMAGNATKLHNLGIFDLSVKFDMIWKQLYFIS